MSKLDVVKTLVDIAKGVQDIYSDWKSDERTDSLDELTARIEKLEKRLNDEGTFKR